MIRLEPLRFAADASGRALVHGRPLPPIEGSRWVVHAGIAIPAGHTWAPAIGLQALRRMLRVAEDGIVLWHAGSGVERVHSEQLLPATRANVRATLLENTPMTA